MRGVSLVRGVSGLNDAISHQHVLLNALLLDVQDLIGICADALAHDVMFHLHKIVLSPKLNLYMQYAIRIVWWYWWHIHVTGSC